MFLSDSGGGSRSARYSCGDHDAVSSEQAEKQNGICLIWSFCSMICFTGSAMLTEEKAPYEPTDMQMGIHQPYIRNVVALEGTTYVFGQNFTTASKIYVDGEYQSTSFINDHVLRLKKTVLDSDAEIAVKQLAPGKARRVLSEGGTWSFRYKDRETEDSGENMTEEGTGEAA